MLERPAPGGRQANAGEKGSMNALNASSVTPLGSRGRLPNRGWSGRSVRHLRGRAIGLGLMATLVTGGPGAAQQLTSAQQLTVRPHEMAIGTQNPVAGNYRLGSLGKIARGKSLRGLDMPPACAGERPRAL